MSAPGPQDVSKTAKTEGGTAKGSTSAQMQSEMVKERNFEQAAQDVGSKLQQTPESVTQEDASRVHRAEARVLGQANPPAGSMTSDAEQQVAVNQGATKSSANDSGALDPVEQSAKDHMHNLEQAKASVEPKIASGEVSKEEADLLHSREQRAFGQTPKGGAAAAAQSTVAAKEKEGGT